MFRSLFSEGSKGYASPYTGFKRIMLRSVFPSLKEHV